MEDSIMFNTPSPAPMRAANLAKNPLLTQGFTLVEMMVTISILSIMLAVAVPSFTEFIANQRVRATASDLHSALLLARSEAIKRNTNMTLSPKGKGWEEGWQMTEGGVATGAVLMDAGPQKGVSFESTTPTAGAVFRPSGRLVGGSIAFEIASSTLEKAQKRCVRVELSGQPSVKLGGCTS
jgi:type IV fimbrial biogenesis protein FimT